MTLKLQNDVKSLSGGYWYRCSRVDFGRDLVRWELSPTSRYSFFEAYEKKPHHQLIKANDDSSLRAFVRAWGPFYFSWPWESERGNSHPSENYRNERDRLVAMVELLGSVEKREEQRCALTHWLEFMHKTANDHVMLLSVRQALQLPGDPLSGFDHGFQNWLEDATSKQIETAIWAVVPLLAPNLIAPNQFFVDRVGRKNVVRATVGLSSLHEALQWMVWQDYFLNFPYKFCEECGKVFGLKNKHETKFCGKVCAHRKASRESYQKTHPK